MIRWFVDVKVLLLTCRLWRSFDQPVVSCSKMEDDQPLLCSIFASVLCCSSFRFQSSCCLSSLVVSELKAVLENGPLMRALLSVEMSCSPKFSVTAYRMPSRGKLHCCRSGCWLQKALLFEVLRP